MTGQSSAQPRRGRRTRCGLRLIGAIGAGLLTAAPAALSAQIKIVVVKDASALTPESTKAVRGRLAPSMSWSKKAALLSDNGIKAFARSPTEFTLTPRNPYRVPGGYIKVEGPVNIDPSYPDPTGMLDMRGGWTVDLVIHRMHPTTQVLLDLFLDGLGYPLTLGDCSYDHNEIDRQPVNAVQHLLLVLATDQRGDACVSLKAVPKIALLKVEVSEIGPAK